MRDQKETLSNNNDIKNESSLRSNNFTIEKFNSDYKPNSTVIFSISLFQPKQTGSYVEKMAYLLAKSDRIKEVLLNLADICQWPHIAYLLLVVARSVKLTDEVISKDLFDKEYKLILNKIFKTIFGTSNSLFTDEIWDFILNSAYKTYSFLFEKRCLIKSFDEEDFESLRVTLYPIALEVILKVREQWLKENKEHIDMLISSGKLDTFIPTWGDQINDLASYFPLAKENVNTLKAKNHRFVTNWGKLLKNFGEKYNSLPIDDNIKSPKFCGFLLNEFLQHEVEYVEARRIQANFKNINNMCLVYPGPTSVFVDVLKRKGLDDAIPVTYKDTTHIMKCTIEKNQEVEKESGTEMPMGAMKAEKTINEIKDKYYELRELIRNKAPYDSLLELITDTEKLFDDTKKKKESSPLFFKLDQSKEKSSDENNKRYN